MRYLKQELDAFFDYYKEHQKIETIPEDINTFATNELISLWKKQNETLYHLLEDKLIYKVPVKIAYTDEEMIEKLSKSEEFNEYIEGILRFFDYYWASHNWYSYADRDKILNFYTNAKYYAQNRYTGPTFLVGDFKVQKNCRFFKTAIKLATKKLSVGFADFLGTMSKDISVILNQRYLEGNLCLSIHPIDYLTASVNKSGWSTCYNPFKCTGDYFRATIAYMMNPYTIIAYLESHKPMHLGELEVSNKKWRNFFYIDEDVLTSVRGYPYDNSALDKIALKTLNELSGNKYKHCLKNIPYSTEYNWIEDEMVSADIYEDDFIENPHTFYCTTDDKYTIRVLDFTAPVICLGCGTINPEFPVYNAGNIICNSCSPKIYCDYCGREIPEKDVYKMSNNTNSCLECLIDGIEAESNPYTIDYCTKEIFEKEDEDWLDLEVAIDETISTGYYINILKKNLPKILKPEVEIKFDKYGHEYIYFDELTNAGIDAMWYPQQKIREDNNIKDPLPRCDYEILDKISFNLHGEVGRYWLMLNL